MSQVGDGDRCAARRRRSDDIPGIQVVSLVISLMLQSWPISARTLPRNTQFNARTEQDHQRMRMPIFVIPLSGFGSVASQVRR